MAIRLVIQVRLEARIVEAVDSLAASEGRSRSQMAARLIARGLGLEAGETPGRLGVLGPVPELHGSTLGVLPAEPPEEPTLVLEP
jgi:hypothetical protein